MNAATSKALGAALLLLGAAGVRAEPEPVWITLGEDAFAAFQKEVAEQPGEPVPVAEGRQGGAVLTRVSESRLSHLSELLHRRYRRCSGFLRHASRAEGLAALSRLAQPRTSDGADAFSLDQSATVTALEALLDPSALEQTIVDLSTDFPNRYHAHPSGSAASQWIDDLWSGYASDRSDVTVEQVTHPGVQQPSVVLTIEGAAIPDEVVVLGGHMDSIAAGTSNPTFPAPGADDNASGIAALSEAIRVAMVDGFRPQRTVSFMAYAAEEVGLVGSQDIAQDYAAAGIDVVAVLQLDMTGYNGSTADIGILSDHTDATLSAFVGSLVDAYQPELVSTSTSCGYACSDHASWTAAGYPAAMPFEARFGEHNPWIHTPSDTYATLGDSVDHAFKFARLATAFLVEIAKPYVVLEPEIFDDGFESGDTSAWTSTVP